MDKAREASRKRDLLKRPSAEQLSADLSERPHRRPRLPLGEKTGRGNWRKKIWPKCPDCTPSSLDSMQWDAHHDYWIHPLCGYTMTQQEWDDMRENDDD